MYCMERRVNNFEPYEIRPIESLDQVHSEGWRIKVYGISAKLQLLPNELVTEGIKYVLASLPKPAITDQRYGVGFLIIHQGTMRNWFLLDWWEQGDILHHLLFSSPLTDPNNITAEPNKTLIACVHELRVINFESESWIKTVLCKDSEPDFEKYLKLKIGSNE